MLARTMKMTVVALALGRRGARIRGNAGHRRPGRHQARGRRNPAARLDHERRRTEVRRTGQQELAPVGNPPITKWFYPNFVVVFENDKVLHAVVVAG